MMTDINSPKQYWQSRYQNDETEWDMGKVSPPIKSYIDTQLQDANRDMPILIAGAGNAHEAKYLHELGFTNVTVVDIASEPLAAFAAQVPTFDKSQLIQADFFALDAREYQFDLSIEQTFFCAIAPQHRKAYVQQMSELLRPNGRLVGVLWDCEFADNNEPPFEGHKAEYVSLFAQQFELDTLARCYNSHPKRQGRELFVNFVKK